MTLWSRDQLEVTWKVEKSFSPLSPLSQDLWRRLLISGNSFSMQKLFNTSFSQFKDKLESLTVQQNCYIMVMYGLKSAFIGESGFLIKVLDIRECCTVCYSLFSVVCCGSQSAFIYSGFVVKMDFTHNYVQPLRTKWSNIT